MTLSVLSRCASVLAASAAIAAGPMTLAAKANCANDNAISVARTVTLDTTGGKLYGGLQYGADNLLRDREVLLTFDDGPLRRHTRKVLKALASHCTKGTFFMVGRMAVSDPAMVREVADAGHTIANHTWSHKNLQRRSARRAGGEVELGISAVRIAAKRPISPFFRFPYLADPNAMIAYGKERDLGIFSIDIDSNDYRTKSSDRVYATVMKQLRARGRGIILFHDIQPSSANAIQRLLDTMQREGYKIVHVASKQPVKTLDAFDKQATELHAKRRTVATAGAIAGGAYEKAPGVKRRLHVSKSKTKNSDAVVSSSKRAASERRENPFSQPVDRPRTSTARAAPEKDWRRAIWGN